MNYLLYGEESYLIDSEVDKIIKKYSIDDMNLVRYQYGDTSIKNIIDDANTVPFFGDYKCIIVNNSIFFNRGKGTEEEIQTLLSYLSNANPSTIIIFININSSIDSTKKISKIMKEKGVIKELNVSNLTSIVNDMFTGYDISKDAIQLFMNRVGDDLDILNKEADKIKVYALDTKKITKEDIIKLTSVSIETDIFKFIDCIINKDKEKSLEMYYEMIKQGEEPIKMIALIASKFRLMYQACELSKSGYSQADISSTLGVHIYPVKLAIQTGLRYSSKVLLKYMNRLATLDIEIKTGKIDAVMGLELLLIEV